MKVGNAVTVSPHGGPKHIGIITDITEDTIYCDEWYSLDGLNCVMSCGFHKKVVKVVNRKRFIEVKEKWEDRPEPIVEK